MRRYRETVVRKYQAHIVCRPRALTLSDGHRYRSERRSVHVMVYIKRVWYQTSTGFQSQEEKTVTFIRGSRIHMPLVEKLITMYEENKIIDLVDGHWSFSLDDVMDPDTWIHYRPEAYHVPTS